MQLFSRRNCMCCDLFHQPSFNYSYYMSLTNFEPLIWQWGRLALKLRTKAKQSSVSHFSHFSVYSVFMFYIRIGILQEDTSRNQYLHTLNTELKGSFNIVLLANLKTPGHGIWVAALVPKPAKLHRFTPLGDLIPTTAQRTHYTPNTTFERWCDYNNLQVDSRQDLMFCT